MVFAVILLFVYESMTSLLTDAVYCANGSSQNSCTTKKIPKAFRIPLSFTLCDIPKYMKKSNIKTTFTKKSVPITAVETKRIDARKRRSALEVDSSRIYQYPVSSTSGKNPY